MEDTKQYVCGASTSRLAGDILFVEVHPGGVIRANGSIFSLAEITRMCNMQDLKRGDASSGFVLPIFNIQMHKYE